MQPLLLERRSDSDGLIESEALRNAEKLMYFTADTDEIDLGKECSASSRHPKRRKASATRSNQGMTTPLS
jgi:hypothetical protein